MSEETTGRITLVWTEDIGTTLAQDEAAGATVLHVDDVSPFNDDGELDENGNLGYLYVGSQTVGYTAVDDDASTITLAEALTAAADEDDTVAVWNDLYGEVDTQQWAWVQPDGKDRQAPIQARVKESLELEDGDRGRRGETCTIRRRTRSDDWRVAGVRGRPSKARGLKHEPDDPHTLTDDEIAAGSFTHTLAHSGIAFDRALLCLVNGVAYPPGALDIDSEDGIVTVTLGGWETTGEAVWFDYWYRQGPVAQALPPDPPAPGEPVPFVKVGAHMGRGVTITSVSFPDGTQAGDLFIYAANNRASATSTCDDARASVVVDENYDLNTARIWSGVVTDPTTPLSVHLTNLGGVQQAVFGLLVLRPDSPIGIDMSQIADSELQGTGPIPGLAGPVSGAVGVGFSYAGIGGTGTHLWPSPWVGYVTNGTYARVSFVTQDSESIAETPALTTDPWRGFALGLELG